MKTHSALLLISLIGLLTGGTRALPIASGYGDVYGDIHDHSVNIDSAGRDVHGSVYGDIHDHSINIDTGNVLGEASAILNESIPNILGMVNELTSRFQIPRY